MGYKTEFAIKNHAEEFRFSTTGIGDPYKYQTESNHHVACANDTNVLTEFLIRKT